MASGLHDQMSETAGILATPEIRMHHRPGEAT